MKYLLDTHTLLWAALEDERLPERAWRIIANPENQILVSAASAWEIATKVRLGKLPDAAALLEDFVKTMTAAGYRLLPITIEHALRAGQLPGAHKDPFDRMLSAQAIEDDLPLLSLDSRLDAFGVRREW